jgi:hypothetical protein
MQLLGHIHRLSVRMYYLIPLHISLIFNMLASARKSISPLLVLFRVTSSTTSFSLPNLSPRMTSLMAPKSRIYQGLRSGLYAGWTTSLLCHRKFNNSPLFETHITIQRHFEKQCACAKKNIFFRDIAAQRGLFETNHKQLQTFPIYFDWNIISSAHDFWQPLYIPARNLGSELVTSQWMLVGGFRCWLRSVLLPVCVTYWVAGRVTLCQGRAAAH